MGETIEEALRRFLVGELGLPPAVAVDSPLAESGLLVSAQLLEVVVFVEDTYGVVMRPVDAVPEKMRSIATIAGVVRERLRERGAP
jgi:acyl carrier protein